jgi:hypothetical protein
MNSVQQQFTWSLLVNYEVTTERKREEEREGPRKLHNEELRDLYCSPKIKEDGMGGVCSM